MKTMQYALIAVVSFFATSGIIHSQETTPPRNNGTATTDFSPAPITTLPDIDQPASSTSRPSQISISLDDVELIDVVRMFSRIASANIIANPEILTARVTVNLDDVEWRPALASILSMHNLALVERPQGSGVFTVVDQPPDAPVPMTVKTIFLDYTTVDEVTAVVERMLSPGANLSTFPSRNAMVIRDTEDSLNDIMRVIAQIDIQSKQVVVETQFMELNDRALKQLGVRWDALAELGVNFQAGPFVTQRESERIRGREDSLERRDSLVRRDQSDRYYDMFGTQIERTEFEVFEVAGLPPQIITRVEPTRTIDSREERSRVAASDILDSTTRAVTTGSAAILNVDSLNIVLSALKSTDGVSIVSNPKIIVASGSTNAFFSVGEREPIIRRTILRGTTDSPGDQIVAELDTGINTDYIRSGYLNTGIELLVVPTVKTDDLIEARIEPSLRRKIGEKAVDGNVWPVIAVKEIRTHFTLESGQTVAIGGLTDTQESKQTSKVPLLGDIPIIGKYLFSHERDETRQTETIIFVTLGLADPMVIGRNEGIPLRSELVHRKNARDRIRRLENQAEWEELERATRKAEEQFERRRRKEPRTQTPDASEPPQPAEPQPQHQTTDRTRRLEIQAELQELQKATRRLQEKFDQNRSERTAEASGAGEQP